MFETPLMKRLGVTPAKLALVGVLAVVLIVVIVLQWPSSSPAPTAANVSDVAADKEEPTPEDRPVAPAGNAVSPARPPVAWPEISLTEVAQHDPFRLPAHLRPARPTVKPQDNPHNRNILQELAEAQGGMILMVGNEHVARVGAKTLRTGDKIGTFRVSKIDATGVWLVDELEESE